MLRFKLCLSPVLHLSSTCYCVAAEYAAISIVKWFQMSLNICYVCTHLDLDVVSVRDYINSHVFIFIATSHGVVLHVVHWI